MRWEDVLLVKARKVLVKGGELRFTVKKRDKGHYIERIPTIETFTDNYVQCDSVVLDIED